jgi:protein subunit release factor B
MPEGTRAISLPDGSITSSFLELFGKPARDTGLQSERNNTFNDAQRLHMLNSSHVQKKIQQGPALQDLVRGAKNNDDLVNSLYLTVLSRSPSNDERASAKQKLQGGGRREAVMDMTWAMFNSTEFLYRH